MSCPFLSAFALPSQNTPSLCAVSFLVAIGSFEGGTIQPSAFGTESLLWISLASSFMRLIRTMIHLSSVSMDTMVSYQFVLPIELSEGLFKAPLGSS